MLPGNLQDARVLSGMRSTGQLHLGHYHGVLENWVRLQQEHECFFFVADWHALTTHYEDPHIIAPSVWDMVVDWLAVGINPSMAKIFIQSQVPEHAELHLLLSMITPLSWLERVPSYKDQQKKLRERDLATYGFLGYPLEGLEKHATFLEQEDRLQARRNIGMAVRLRALVADLIAERLLANADELLATEASAIAAGERSVLHAAERVVEEIVK